MRLETIWIKNFGPFHEILIDLRGVHSATISGPNGAGKSAAFYEAIMWCLWKTCRAKDPDNFIRLGETDMAVILTASITGQLHRFSRERSIRTKKGTSSFSIEVASGDGWVPVNKTVKEILQVDHNVLTSSNFLGYGEGAKFCKAQPADRIKILSQMLGITHYADYATLARKAGDEARGELTALLPQREELETTVAKRDDAIAKLREAEARVEKLAGSLAQQQQAIEEKIQQKANAEASLAAMGEADPTFHQTQVGLLGMHVERLESRMVELAGVVSREANLLVEQGQLNAATAELTNLRSARDQRAIDYRDLEKAIEKIQEERQTLFTQKAGLESEKTKLETECEGLRQRIAEYERALADDKERAGIAQSLQALEGRMAEYDAKIAAKATELESCEVELGKATETEKSVKERLSEARAQQKIAENLRAQWVKQYQAETEQIQAKIKQESGHTDLLLTVPCSVDLQRQCGFTKDAAHKKDVLIPELKRQLAGRITDQAALEYQAPFDSQSHAEQARTCLVQLDQININSFRVGRDLASREVAELRQLRSGLEQEVSTIRKSLPDVAYIAKATAEIPELLKAVALKESALRSILKDLETVQAEIRDSSLKEKLDEREVERDRLDKLDQLTKKVEQDVSRLQPCLEGLVKVAHAKEAIPGVQQDLEGKRAEILKARAELEKALTHATRKTELQKKVELAAVHLQACREAVETTAELQRAVQSEIVTLTSVIQSTTEAHTKLEALTKRCAGLESTIQRAKWLLEAYKRIPLLIIENSADIMEEEANRTLRATSSDGMSVKLRTQKPLKGEDRIVDALDIIVRDFRGERPYECYSGGEGGLIELGFRFGGARLAGARCMGPKIETLVVDEGFSAMDNEFVLPRMRKFLAEKASEFPLMLIITHNEDFKGTLGSQITVAKGEFGSTVEIA